MKKLIMIVDDEQAVRDSLSSVLSTYGYDSATFGSARGALAALPDIRPSCMVLDVRMPDLDGLQTLRLLRDIEGAPPVIVITGHADVQMAVQAMKMGAVDFLEKPVIDEDLAESIRLAVAASPQQSGDDGLGSEMSVRYATLTAREKDVADLVVEGYSSSAIASLLDISVRTVDHHRASILAKMQATSLPQLLRFLLLVPRRAGGEGDRR